MPAHQNIIAYGLNRSTGRGRVATCMTGQPKNRQEYVELLVMHSTSASEEDVTGSPERDDASNAPASR